MLELPWTGEEDSIKKCGVLVVKKCTLTPSPKLSTQTKLLLGPGTYASVETGTRTQSATNVLPVFGGLTAKHVQVVPALTNALAMANATTESTETATAIAMFPKTTHGCWRHI